MHVFICDDEEICLRALENCITRWAEEHSRRPSVTVRQFRSSEDMLDVMEHGPYPDMLFMDIQIPGEMNGIQAAQQVFSKNEHIPIVFLTNYIEFACDGYKVNALRYLLKPVTQADIDECMDIAWRRWLLLRETAIVLESHSNVLSLPAETILYIEAVRHDLKFFTVDQAGEHTIRYTFKQLKKQLTSGLLVQCHRSFIVNVRYVRGFQNGTITLSTGKQIPIGRNFSQQFVDAFKRYYGVGQQ